MSNLSKYAQNAQDKTYPDCEESVFGHMVLELGMSPDEAVQNLRPWVRDLDRSAASSKNTAFIAAFIGAGAGLATAATIGIGVAAIIPIAAAAYNFLIGQQSAREQSVRNSEYLLLKSCPELLKLIWALFKRGMPKEALIECYDDLLGAFTVQYQHRASLGLSDELDHDIVRSFEEILKQKSAAELLGRSIVADTQDFKFDTLYQSTEPTVPRVEPSQSIGNETRLGAVNVPAEATQQTTSPIEPFSIPITSPESKLFDWNQLNAVYDDFPHLLLIGKTGAGKSFLAEKLGYFLDGSTIVITPKKKPKDFIGMQVIGVPYDFATIAANIEGLSKLVKDREAQMNQTGDDNFSPVNVVLDEVPTFVAGCKELGLDVVKDLKFIIRAGRTSKVRLILLAQGQEVKTLGIEGEGSLRDNLSYVYLKGFAEAEAQRLKLDVSQYDRPCLIDGKVADIAALIASTPTQTAPSQVDQDKVETRVTQDLERMFNAPSADHEVEEGLEASSLRPQIEAAFPSWKPKSIEVATAIADYLAARPDKALAPGTIKQSVNRRIKEDQSLPTEKIKAVLDLLVSAQLLIEQEGKYSVAQASDIEEYDF